MQFHLVVTSPFVGRAAGDMIIDADTVEQSLQSHPDRVVKVAPPKPATVQKED